MVQTFSPGHRAIQCATKHDYVRFAEEELPEREEFHYPPFTSIFRLVFRGSAETTTLAFAEAIRDKLTKQLNDHNVSSRLLGPVPAPINRMHGKFRFHMLIQTIDRAAVSRALRETMVGAKTPDGVQWIIDADAISML